MWMCLVSDSHVQEDWTQSTNLSITKQTVFSAHSPCRLHMSTSAASCMTTSLTGDIDNSMHVSYPNLSFRGNPKPYSRDCRVNPKGNSRGIRRRCGSKSTHGADPCPIKLLKWSSSWSTTSQMTSKYRHAKGLTKWSYTKYKHVFLCAMPSLASLSHVRHFCTPGGVPWAHISPKLSHFVWMSMRPTQPARHGPRQDEE